MDPIHQFEIKNLFPIAKIGNVEIAFTNSALYMLIAVGIIALLMIGFTSRRAMVPGRFQALTEITYEFIATSLRRSAGPEGMTFFPLVFSLFMFILVLNIISIIPHTFAVMAQIIITASLALLVFFTVIIYGFWKHGFRFLKLFVPGGVPNLYPSIGNLHRGTFVFIAPALTQRSLVRQHPCRSYHALCVWCLCHYAGHSGSPWLGRCCYPPCYDSGADGSRIADRLPSGVRIRHSHVHLSQRCDPPWTLNP
jgi:hypothetical protein